MAEDTETPTTGAIDPFPIPQPEPVPAWKQAVLDAITSAEYATTKTAIGQAMAGVAADAPMSPLLVQLSALLSVMYNLETEANR